MNRYVKDAKYSKETNQGWQIIETYKMISYGDFLYVVIVHRPKSDDYAVGWNYFPEEGYWQQGHYDFKTLEGAQKYVQEHYPTSRLMLDSKKESLNLTQEQLDELNEKKILTGLSNVRDDGKKIHSELYKNEDGTYSLCSWADDEEEKVRNFKDFNELVKKYNKPDIDDVRIEDEEEDEQLYSFLLYLRDEADERLHDMAAEKGYVIEYETVRGNELAYIIGTAQELADLVGATKEEVINALHVPMTRLRLYK